jgi:phosphosulfolactate synthase (CoM biosynthesis protein A)
MDLSFIADFFNQIIDFITYVWDFIYTGIYDLVKEFLVALTKAAIYAYLSGLIFVADIARDAVMSILQDFGIIQAIKNAYGLLPPEIQSLAAYFRIPESLGVIFTAFPTRWAMSFIPFIGR